MEPFRRLDAAAVPLPEPNIDTDRIIPARFLSRLRGVDHAPFLFHDARRLPGSDDEDPAFPLNRPEWMVKSRTYPLLNATSAAIADMLDRRRKGEPMLGPRTGNTSTPA